MCIRDRSNIIYPNSFSKRTQSQVNKKTVNISTLNKKKLTKMYDQIFNENSIYGHAIYESIDLVYLEEYIIKRLYKIF